ncbi:zf-C3HC4 domain-containing protein/IBR domain-containing protein, partial [Cephalotus follicularis]
QILQPQETIMASIITSQMSEKLAISSSSEATQEILIEPQDSMQLTAEACESPCCKICFEKKEGGQIRSIDGCIHSFCIDCISKHVASKIDVGICNVTCPGLNCKSVLQPETFMPILPKEVLDHWGEALCKNLIDGFSRFYCPFEDCSAMLMNDNKNAVQESECPLCHRLFCVQCKVPWHSGVKCEEYQRLDEDERAREDLMLRELVKEKKWSRCPNCKFYVERTEGCPHITCRQV